MFGLPKILKSEFDTAAASIKPEKTGVSFDSLSAKTTALAPLRSYFTSGIDKPKTVRACNSNSEKFCVPAKVTIPVSCGRGESSEK